MKMEEINFLEPKFSTSLFSLIVPIKDKIVKDEVESVEISSYQNQSSHKVKNKTPIPNNETPYGNTNRNRTATANQLSKSIELGSIIAVSNPSE